MGEATKIEWTDHTFNPWIGCAHVHAGCTNCYAEAYAKRYGRAVWGPAGTRVKTTEAYWRKPLAWNAAAEAAGERRRVFCASLADVFEDWAGPIVDAKGNRLVVNASGARFHCNAKWEPCYGERLLSLDDMRRDLLRLIDSTPALDWLLLSKRPENVRRMWPMVREAILPDVDPGEWYRANVWLGTSVSDQATADKLVPRLLECRGLCPVLFLSCEPLLGPITLPVCATCGGAGEIVEEHDPYARELLGCPYCMGQRSIDWVIVGGESGPHARACDLAWIRSIRDQCRAAGVPVFVKQLGRGPLDTEAALRLADAKGGDWNEWPADLRVREFPASAAAESDPRQLR
jgi:protein gp37